MQQLELELALMSNALSAAVSLVVAIFLFRLWHKQENRMWTDLPFIFAITFIAMVANTSIQVFTLLYPSYNTLEVFRIRAMTISGSALPLLAALLAIWLPRFQHRHAQIMLLSIAYWFTISLIGPTEVFIMALLIPLLLAFSFGMIVTFAITWKTGRLQEVRSDLMVVSIGLGFVSQAIKIPMQAAGFDWVILSIAALTAVLAGIALYNPWFRRQQAPKPVVAPYEELDYLSAGV